jgi:hypothetical protein
LAAASDLALDDRADAVIESHDRFARRLAQLDDLPSPKKRVTDD